MFAHESQKGNNYGRKKTFFDRIQNDYVFNFFSICRYEKKINAVGWQYEKETEMKFYIHSKSISYLAESLWLRRSFIPKKSSARQCQWTFSRLPGWVGFLSDYNSIFFHQQGCTIAFGREREAPSARSVSVCLLFSHFTCLASQTSIPAELEDTYYGRATASKEKKKQTNIWAKSCFLHFSSSFPANGVQNKLLENSQKISNYLFKSKSTVSGSK